MGSTFIPIISKGYSIANLSFLLTWDLKHMNLLKDFTTAMNHYLMEKFSPWSFLKYSLHRLILQYSV